ncbi:hypothetical protein JCGZ_05075 [Jatropha curcas]|uniref:Aminotransferase-like plant mobile domain-containing protein n=1 Tax=Jatropha curcas TaxID=180498 RepID=A0A067L5X8_JATCU|nr:hypothetical protein JCGZ_05075 [Jatropha curcas]
MRARVVTAGFGDYAAGLRRTQPRFPPAMRYALMERRNGCAHTFIFGFGEMTLTPVDYTAITGLRFTGPVPPLDARYQTATLGAQLVRSLLGVTTQTRYTAQGCVSYEIVYRFLAERIRTRLANWGELPVEARPAAPAYTREERDQAARSFLFYIRSSQLLCTSQNKGDPAVLACLRDLSQVGSFDWATLVLAHLYHGLDVWTRGSGESNWLFIRPLEVWSYEYRIYLGGPSGDTLAESRRIPRYLAHCHHTYASGEDPEYWRSFLNNRELSDRRVPHAPPRHMCLLEGLTREDLKVDANDFLSAGDFPAYFSSRMQARVPEILEYTQAGAAVAPARPAGIIPGDVPFPPGLEVVLDPDLGLGSGITIPAGLRRAPPLPQLDPEQATHCLPRDTWRFAREDLEIGRLRRHQSRQSSAVSRLQAEVDQLRTRLEVEGIPLDSSKEDDDGSSSDDVPLSPPPQVAAGPSHRQQ